MNKKKQLKNLIKKPKLDKVNRMLDMAKKHGTIRVKHKEENFVLLTTEEYNKLMSQREELQSSISSLLKTIDVTNLSDPKRHAESDQIAEDILKKY